MLYTTSDARGITLGSKQSPFSRSSAVDEFAKFPIRETPEALNAALHGRNIESLCPNLFTLITTNIKPYSGGNEAIWPIHQLDIRDKHRLLIPIGTYSSINDIKMEDASGEIDRGSTYGTRSGPPWHIDVLDGHHVHDKGKLGISVFIEDASMPRVHIDAEILFYCSQTILGVVKVFENFLETECAGQPSQQFCRQVP